MEFRSSRSCAKTLDQPKSIQEALSNEARVTRAMTGRALAYPGESFGMAAGSHGSSDGQSLRCRMHLVANAAFCKASRAYKTDCVLVEAFLTFSWRFESIFSCTHEGIRHPAEVGPSIGRGCSRCRCVRPCHSCRAAVEAASSHFSSLQWQWQAIFRRRRRARP